MSEDKDHRCGVGKKCGIWLTGDAEYDGSKIQTDLTFLGRIAASCRAVREPFRSPVASCTMISLVLTGLIAGALPPAEYEPEREREMKAILFACSTDAAAEKKCILL
jgi:hypothetical protein